MLIIASTGASELAEIVEMTMEEQKKKDEEMLTFDHETGRLDDVWKSCNSVTVRDMN